MIYRTNLRPAPPSRVTPGSRNITPAFVNAVSIARKVLARGSVAPRSIFLMLISETPDWVARSDCFQPKRARAARIWIGKSIPPSYAAAIGRTSKVASPASRLSLTYI